MWRRWCSVAVARAGRGSGDQKALLRPAGQAGQVLLGERPQARNVPQVRYRQRLHREQHSLVPQDERECPMTTMIDKYVYVCTWVTIHTLKRYSTARSGLL